MKKLFHPLAPKTSCKYRNEKLIMNHAKTTTTTKQTSKQTNKQAKNKMKGTNYISLIFLELNYLAAFMHTGLRNYLLRVHWIVLTLSKWHLTKRVFNGLVWKIVRLKSCCVSIHRYIYIKKIIIIKKIYIYIRLYIIRFSIIRFNLKKYVYIYIFFF